MAQTWPRDSDTTFEVKRSKVKVTGAGHIVAVSRTACLVLQISSMKITIARTNDSNTQLIKQTAYSTKWLKVGIKIPSRTKLQVSYIL